MISSGRDLHVLKYFSSVITVSHGKVINVTEPSLRHCPLAFHFYREFKEADPGDPQSLRDAIGRAVESKIRDYGFFTKKRTFHFPPRAVPYGASEMLAASLKSRMIEKAVVVCDGAGTVITDSPETVQGIGARMNTLIFTSPVKEILEKLEQTGCCIVSKDNAWIDQVKGVEKALSSGDRKIGVTVVGSCAEQLGQIRELERKMKAEITLFAVCTSGISEEKIEMIRRHADLAWACASCDARKRLGRTARLQLSQQIPVYALTERGVKTALSFLGVSKDLVDPDRQYLVSRDAQGIPLGAAGIAGYYLRAIALPAESSKNPC